jgi:hypothetical protein
VTRPRPEVLVFRFDERAEVLAAMAELGPSHGWLTLQAGFDAEADLGPRPQERTGTRLGSGRRGPVVPTCTWVPGERSRRHGPHTAVGIDHGTGTRVVPVLDERQVPVPERWVVTQDNATRGLVLALPPDEAHDVVLDWILRAGLALSIATLTGEWRALLHRR